MRVGAAIFLLIGLALLGWGAWLLYARYVGGPEFYQGKPDETKLREADAALADLRESQAKVDARVATLRAESAKLPEGAAARVEAETQLAKVEKSRAETTAVLARGEELRDKMARQVEADRDEARGRTTRRGWLFTAVGLFWTLRAASGLRRATPPA